MTRRCQDHCARCGTHFTSVAAFDAHRVGPVESRMCLQPWEDARFVRVTAGGVCSMYSTPTVGVALWTLVAHVEGARQRFRSEPPLRDSGGGQTGPPGPRVRERAA